MNVDAAVIGGGVSGLATAFELHRRGHRVAVLERQARAGGNAVSERLGGFLMEHGPSTVNATSPAAHALSRRLGIDHARCELGAGVRRRYLVGDGALRGIAVHPLGFLTTAYLSPAGRLRMAVEALIGRGGGAGAEETVAGFFRRRFGAEFTERIVDPLVGGLFAGCAEEVSMAAAFPRLLALEEEFGSVIRGMVRSRRRGGAMPGRRLFSWLDGIASLPRALAGALGDAVHTGVAVRRLGAAPGGFHIDLGAAGKLRARAVVVATQPHVGAGLLAGLDADAADAVAGIEAPPLAVVFLGYARRQVAHPLDGLGYLTPRREGRLLNGAQFCSTMFPGRAPAGHVAVAGYVGGARAPEAARLSADDLVDLARQELADLIGARGAPCVARVRHWPLGLPQYRTDHGARIARLRAAEARRPGLFVTGNYFAGPAIAACLGLAAETAAKADRFLAQTEERRQARSASMA